MLHAAVQFKRKPDAASKWKKQVWNIKPENMKEHLVWNIKPENRKKSTFDRLDYDIQLLLWTIKYIVETMKTQIL